MKRILWIINYYVIKKRLVWTVILVAILVVFLLTGCKTKTVLVPVKETKIEYRDEIAQLEDALESTSAEGEELFN